VTLVLAGGAWKVSKQTMTEGEMRAWLATPVVPGAVVGDGEIAYAGA
jgi:hypothetical protein